MATEIYLQPELEELVTDPDKKQTWENKILELELEGQVSLTQNSQKSSASPYTHMNEHIKNVFEVLCPTKVKVEKYNKTQIPIDVLSHLALCKQEGYFTKMEIWYDNINPDPILVGYITDSYSSSIIHLVARWGDEIVPFELLVDKAVARLTKVYKQYTDTVIAEAKLAAATAETRVKGFIYGKKSIYQLRVDNDLTLTNTEW
jgi:hypothetical protein